MKQNKYNIPENATAQQVCDLLEMYTSGLDFRNAFDVSRYEAIIRSYFTGIRAFEIKITEPDTILTRGRKHDNPRTLFPNISDVLYPPKKKALINRANAPGELIYYCSGDPGITIYEVKPKIGDWVTTIDLNFSTPMIDLLVLGVDLSDKHHLTLNEIEKGVHIFLRRKFEMPVPADENHLYYLTITFIRLYLNKKDGVMYPSIASGLTGYNIALKTDFIDKYMQFKQATVHEVTNIKPDYEIEVKCLYYAQKLNKHKDFKWERVTNCNGHSMNRTTFHL